MSQIFYGGPVMFIVTCFFAQPDCRNFLSEHCIMWGGVAIFVAFAPSWCFSRKARYIAANQPMPIKQAKKTYIKTWDTNNSTQSLTRMYHHTSTESLHRLCGAKISRPPTLARVTYQFGFIRFSICLQCEISGSSVFSIFSHEVSHHKVR